MAQFVNYKATIRYEAMNFQCGQLLTMMSLLSFTYKEYTFGTS